MTLTDSLSRLTASLASRYRIERELGQGGMATVYLAEDLKHKRRVAIKVLRPELAAAIGPDRFLREIETTAGLRHPNILPLFDSGTGAHGHGGTEFLYYVMPVIEGESLRDRLDREKQLPLEDALRLTGEVAEALTYAHGRGVVHRDIKPDNIMIEGGHAVVADFGIAKAVRAGAGSLTQTGMAIGSPAYMSPEQAAGEATLDGRSDLYALACVTYEMLAGQPPFTGPTVESVVHQHLAAEPRPVTQLRSAIPAAVAQAVQRALAKNPVDRFATPSAFAAALRAEGAARPGRTRQLVLAAGMVMILAAAGAGWSLLGGKRSAGLDANVIAVLPFRVGGSGVEYLRESMLDLLSARLNGEAGPRVVEPRTALSAWRRAISDPSRDLSEDESRRVARELGAGRVLLGSAISTPTELTLTGSLIDVASGAVAASGSVAGSPDSVAVLVNRLAARLLSLGAGESRERLDGLAATSLEALQEYLAGQVEYRRGDYHAAMNHFGAALARDSSFVQAALGLVTANPYIGNVLRDDGFRAIPLVWRLRERLSERDRALFFGFDFVGPNYPGPSTHAETIAQSETAAAAAPASAEHWLSLGKNLLQYGAAASVEGWQERGAAALDRAIALDSSFAPALTIRLYVARSPAEFAATRRVAELLEEQVTAGFADAMILWARAVVQGDSAAARRYRGPVGESRINYLLKLLKLPLHAAQYALPLDDARWANETMRREGATEQERNIAWLGERAVEFAAGRLREDYSVWGSYNEDWGLANLIQQAMVEPPYRDVAHRRAAAAARPHWPPLRDCYVEQLRASGGDTSTTRAAIARLRAFAARNPPPIPSPLWIQMDFRVCPLLLEAMLEGGDKLDSLEALMRGGPRWFSVGPPSSPVVAGNWTVARLREAEGDIAAALAAVRRRETTYYPAYLWTLPALLRQEGRLAALAGDTAGAIAAYDRYLTLRTDPDPPFRPQRDSVLAERRALGRQ